MPNVPDRAALSAVFQDPRTLRAFEDLFQAAGSSGSTFSSGDLKPYAGSAAPDGWLECDGSPVSRVAYQSLFVVLGETWGPGDGSTTFNLPDLRARALIGADGSHALASTGGAASVTLSVGQLPSHTHAVTDPGHTHASVAVDAGVTSAGASADGVTAGVTGSAVTGITIGNTGSGNPVPTLSPYVAVLWLIKT